jgi:hypothetical protein
MNFHRHTDSDKGAIRVTHHAKASSAGSTEGDGNGRGLFRRALATRGISSDAKGSGGPSRRLCATLALAMVALVVTAAPASAAPEAAEVGVITNISYASAQVTGRISSPGGSFGFPTQYVFEYSKNPSTEGWSSNPEAEGAFPGVLMNKAVSGELKGLKGSTQYFVRLVVKGFGVAETSSPEPHKTFTTLAVDPPTIGAANDATQINSLSARATGTVTRPANADPSFNVTCKFEYVTDDQFTATGFDGAASTLCAENPINEADAGVSKSVSAQIGCPNWVAEAPESKCLQPATVYHLRLSAENGAPSAVTKAATNTFTTLAAVEKPAVISIGDATDPTFTTAKASGEVQRPVGADPALDVSCRFEYVTEDQFTATGFEGAGQMPCAETAEGLIAEAGTTTVTAVLNGLAHSTTYHLRLVAENGAGDASKEAASTFTTVTQKEPTLTVIPATAIAYTKADLSGTIDPEGGTASGLYGYFEYSSEPANPDSWISSYDFGTGGGFIFEGLAGTDPVPVGGTIKGLKPGTTYAVRLRATNFGDLNTLSPEPYLTFTTKGTSTPPSVTLDPVTAITAHGAHFAGLVDINAPAEALSDEAKAAYETDWRLECTPECPSGSGSGLSGTISAEEGSKVISTDAIRLEANTAYEVKLIAENVFGTFETPIRSFPTPLVAPTVKPSPGASDGEGGYTLEGTVNPNNSDVTDCKFEWGPNSGSYAFSAPCSPEPGGGGKAVTVEAHLTGLTPGATYHAKLVATNAGGPADGGDQAFIPTLKPKQACDNEAVRAENNSLALPECRAYEMVSSPGKEGFPAKFQEHYGEKVLFTARAGSIAGSGQANAISTSDYFTRRTASGWEVIPNLSGPTGSIFAPPINVRWFFELGAYYSVDLSSSIWMLQRTGAATSVTLELRKPDGLFTLIGNGNPISGNNCCFGTRPMLIDASDDLSHSIYGTSVLDLGNLNYYPSSWGPGVYEFVGTGNGDPLRVDIDNAGNPAAECNLGRDGYDALGASISDDGRVIAFAINVGCGEPNRIFGIWARVAGTTSFNVSASQCSRTVGDPGGPCNALSNATYQGAATDGSRIFFTTKQQLVDGDVDQTDDLYACDIPSGTPTPIGKANACAALRQVSGADTGGDVADVVKISKDGSTVYLTARGVLAANEGTLGDTAVAGDRNLYIWHTDAEHPDGQTRFVARLSDPGPDFETAQITGNNRFLLFVTATPLAGNDTDEAKDVYRYDADSGLLIRVSTGLSGVGGNGDGFNALTSGPESAFLPLKDRYAATAVSEDGQKVVFVTDEPLSPLDGNKAPDVYLWTPAGVSLVTTGSVEGAASGAAYISESGRDIFFHTRAALSPADPDVSSDVYDARIGGGFSFAKSSCAGEACQSPAPAPPTLQGPDSARPGPGNPTLRKACRQGKIRKHGKCVKKKHKQHHKKSNKKTKRSGGDRGGSK